MQEEVQAQTRNSKLSRQDSTRTARAREAKREHHEQEAQEAVEHAAREEHDACEREE